MASESDALLIAVTAVLFCVVIVTGVWLQRMQYRMADAKLLQWSREFQYSILDKQLANPLGTGPGVLRASDKRIRFRVLVEDVHGVRRRATVTIGSRLTAMGDLVVEWES